MKATRADAYQLIHDGILAFANMEEAGMRVDIGWFESIEKELTGEIEATEEQIANTPEGKKWIRKYGRVDVDASSELKDVLFKICGHKPFTKTPTGQPKIDEDILRKLGLDFTNLILRSRKLRKARSTYVRGILRESTQDGYVHPSFNLNTVLTYRGSCDGPNLQNIPIRDPDVAAMIRPGFLASAGCRLLELDFSGQEVRVSACYHKDPRMVQYIKNDYDMHREMAAKLFCLRPEEVSKKLRYHGKNGFVFPQFYGSYWELLAKGLWDSVHEEGTLHGLKKRGIKTLRSFEHHVKDVEEEFWGKTFPVYAKWKKDWWAAYQRRGYFDLLTGFRCQGVYRRNQVINSPVQGAAFHCLLWCLIELDKWLVENKMETRIVSQVHDSILVDVVDEEFDDVLDYAVTLMKDEIAKEWEWLIVPLNVEAEASEIEGNWFEKEEVEL